MKNMILIFAFLLFGCVTSSKQVVKPPVNPPAKPSVIPNEQKLINQLSSPDEAVAKKAIYTLGRQDNASEAVVKKYEEMFKNYRDYNRLEMLLDAIYTYDNQIDFLPGLEVCLNSPSENIREEAIDIIGDIEDKRAIDVLIKALANPYPDIRTAARDDLETITDKSFDCQPRWKEWWKKHRDSFEF